MIPYYKEVILIRKQANVRLDEKLHTQLKIIAIKNGTSVQKIVEDYLKEYVAKHQDKKE